MKTIICFSVFIFASFFPIKESNAQTNWQWAVNGSANNLFEGWAATADPFGNVIAIAYNENTTATLGLTTVTNTHGNSQLVVMKIDSNGNFLWAIGTQNANVWGTTVATDVRGNSYLFGGYYNHTISFGSVTLTNPSTSSIASFLVKVSPYGTVVWAQNVNLIDLPYLSSLGLGTDTIGTIGIDGANNIYLSNRFSRPQITIGATTLYNNDPAGGKSDIVIAKYDTLGNPIWAKDYGGTNNDYPIQMSVTPFGNIYLMGAHYAPGINIGSTSLADSLNFLAKFDSSGTPVWAVNLNRNIVVCGLTSDIKEDVYMTGGNTANTVWGSSTLIDSGQYNFFLAKFSNIGSIEWARSGVGTGQDIGYSVSVDKCGKVLVSGGATDYSMNFNGHILAIPTYSTFNDPMFIVTYDTAGNYLSGDAYKSGGDDNTFISVDNRGDFFLAGDILIDTLVLGNDTLISNYGPENLFVAKYRYDSLGCYCTTAPIPYFTNTGIDTVHFTYTGTTNYDSLTWHFGDGSSSNAINPVHTYTASGTYIVCVDAHSNCATDGYSQRCDTITITDSLTRILNINGDGSISIYPNPAKNDFTIHSNSSFPSGSKAEIYDINGKLLNTWLLTGTNVIVRSAGLAPGIYQCRIIMPGVKSEVKKLVIMK